MKTKNAKENTVSTIGKASDWQPKGLKHSWVTGGFPRLVSLGRYYGKVFLLIWLCLSASAHAQTLPVAQSGINWTNSTLTVLRFQPSDPTHRPNFRCFGENYQALPLSQSLAKLGFSNPDSGPLTLTQALEDNLCFQQAGWYQLRLELHDYAGNVSQKQMVLTIVPGALSLTDSTFAAVASNTNGGGNVIADLTDRLTCTSPTLVADGEDECVLELRLRDRFANVLKPDALSGHITVSLPTESVADNLDASQNPYGAFLAGLRFSNDQTQFKWRFPSAEERLQVGLKSLVPTLEQREVTGVGQPQLELKPQPINFGLEYQTSLDGEVVSTSLKTVKPLFSPWVNVVARPQGSLENFVLLPLNRAVTLPLQLSGAVGKSLPTRVSLDWTAPELESLWVRFLDSEEQRQTKFKSLLPTERNPQPFTLDLELVQPEGTAVGDEAFALEPVVTYPQTLDEKTALVRYPIGLLTGKAQTPLPPFEPLRLQAAVEGRTLSETDSATASNLVLAGTDKLLFTGWREQVNRQAISLIRGQSPRTERTFNLNQDWGDRNIAYFKGVTVRLESDDEGNTPMRFDQGIKTIIVEDGNVHLTRDLKYDSVDDSLGVIVINSKPNDPLHGHVFVHQNVQQIAGSYFLDGALVSTQKLLDPNITDTIEGREDTSNQNPDAPLALQLVLEGTLVARNTLGGADLSPARGPGGQNLKREIALNYDLNYLRRYEPLFNAGGQRVPDAQNNFCFKPDGQDCYPNPAPTVIRYDARVQLKPPPGFEARQ